MKFIVLLLCYFTLVYSFTEEHDKKVQKVIKECQKDPATQASEGWLKNGEQLYQLEGEGAHIFCRLKKLGSLKKNGDVDKKGMEKDLTIGIEDPEKVKVIVEKCGTRRPGTSPEMSAIDNFRCVKAAAATL